MYQIDIPIIPRTLQTQRSRIGSYGQHYMDTKAQEYQDSIKHYCFHWAKMNNYSYKDKDKYSLDIFLIKPKPKNWFPGKFPTQGDVDNYTKTILDGIKGILFPDDNLIFKLTVSKTYGDYPCIRLRLKNYPIPEKKVKKKNGKNKKS